MLSRCQEIPASRLRVLKNDFPDPVSFTVAAQAFLDSVL
jgi:hypothetical protein